jgi:selenocysteine lyase/cysteine desulfurase
MTLRSTDRRQFVKSLAVGAAAAPVLSVLTPLRQAFARDLDRLELDTLTARTFVQMRSEYLLDPSVTYLNHASIGTIPHAVFDARSRYLEVCERNPWLYMWGGAWEQPREDVRAKAADFLGCKAAEVSFTHNTTEAFNLLANGLPLGPGDEVVFSSLNHDGASVCWAHMAPQKGFAVKRFQFPATDVSRLTKADVLNLYDEQITPQTRVLAFPHIDNMVGLRHPVRELAELAHSKGVEFVAVDAAQTAGMFEVDVDEMGVEMFAASPHKWLQAPKGTGLMYLRDSIRENVHPMWVTWGQRRDGWTGTGRIFEDYGTRNHAEVLTLGDAIEFQARMEPGEREARLRELWEYTRRRAMEHPRTDWRSPHSWEMGGSLYAVEIRDKNIAEVSQWMFEEHGIVFRPFRSQGLNTARISPNIFTTEEEIERFFRLATA